MDTNTASTWLEIDRSIIRENTRILCRHAGVLVMAVTKGNAYGHGAGEVARAAVEGGAQWVGVARLEEARVVREAGVTVPILVLGFVHPLRAAEIHELQATVPAFDLDMATALSDQAVKIGCKIPVHVKVDSGMRRLGTFAETGKDFFLELMKLPGLQITGLFTHFPILDEVRHPTTYIQLARFKKLVAELDEAGINRGLVHGITSAGLLYLPEARFDMVRTGIAVVGLQSTADMPQFDGIRPAMAWKTQIISIKTIPAGEGVGYNHRYFTKAAERIGVIAAGYGDGVRRRLGNFVLVGGKRVNVVGGMCMDQCMVNLDEVPDARVGDEVVLIGRQGDAVITAEEIAANWNTTNYEVVTGIRGRVQRYYI